MNALAIPGKAAVFLGQGELHATATPTMITTILGSCVSVCLWDPGIRAGGMNHIVLAHGGSGSGDPRYGDAAVAALVGAMLDLGASQRRLVAKVFGGGAVLPLAEPHRSIGTENARIALDELRRLRIPVLANSVGGREGMTIRFDTHSGEVSIRRFDAGCNAP